MLLTHRPILLLVIAALLTQLSAAQKSQEITIQEPGIYELLSLFRQADTVALVKIVAGDAEAYEVAVYKAAIIKGFKGGQSGETIYFGPYLGERVGSEYIVFLYSVPKTITPKGPSNAGYGTVHYSRVFNEGYTSMEASYECVFDGKEIDQKCDYGVRVCTDYIKLPKSLPTFPPGTEETPFGCRWVRKSAFVALLDTLSKPENGAIHE